MTQAAKAQEPSMEEILASIRRIIADDEAKPVAGEAAPVASPEPPAVRPQAMAGVPPSAIKPARAPAPPAPPPPASAAAASNSQDDIDAMLASLEADTSEAEVRPAPPEPEADVFELTEQMAVPATELQTIEADDDLEFSEPPAIETTAYTRPYEPPQATVPAPAPAMLSQSTVFAVESAFNSLANTVLSNNARTLEDLVKEMLRPMLKSWLDDNLPNLVERIVKAEIERVSRGR